MDYDSRQFLISSDFPIDKVIYRSAVIPFPVPAFDFRPLSVPNPVGKLFLPISQFSLTSDFSGSIYDINSGAWDGGFQSYQTAISLGVSSIDFVCSNNTASAITIYIRLVGLPIDGLDYSGVPYTNEYQSLQVNTDDNYMKLLQSSSVNVAVGATATIDHGLGYPPRTLIWGEQSGTIFPVTAILRDFVFGDSGITPSLSNTSLSIKNDLLSPATVHYRIYTDN